MYTKIKLLAAAVSIMALSACTTSQAVKNTKSAPSDIANAPVKALNLKKKDIPEFLVDADTPYLSAGSSSCADINTELGQLTEFLGPDWDSADHYSKVGGTGGNLFDAILPYGGLVRFMSGASKHEKKLLQAADYASVRRAYLKTTAANKGCVVQ